MIAETISGGLLTKFSRRFVDPHAGVTYEIPQQIDHSWKLGYGFPLAMKGQNGELQLNLHNGNFYVINLNTINDSVGFKITDPTLTAGVHVDIATGGINIPADEHRNPHMLYNLMNGIARISYYQNNSQTVEAYADVLSDHLATYSPELPIPFSKERTLHKQQLDMWRNLCNQEIDISLETLQLIKDGSCPVNC